MYVATVKIVQPSSPKQDLMLREPVPFKQEESQNNSPTFAHDIGSLPESQNIFGSKKQSLASTSKNISPG